MRAFLILLLLSLLTTVPQARAVKRAKALTRQEIKFMARLQKKCDDGDGQACYDYAAALRQLGKSKKNDKMIARFVRRACMLAYMPACNRKDRPVPARVVSNAHESEPETRCGGTDPMSSLSISAINLPGGSHGQQITRLQKNSLFEKAGLRVGDVVTRINGSELTNSSQITKALEDGGAMVEVQRGRSIVPLALSCP